MRLGIWRIVDVRLLWVRNSEFLLVVLVGLEKEGKLFFFNIVLRIDVLE